MLNRIVFGHKCDKGWQLGYFKATNICYWVSFNAFDNIELCLVMNVTKGGNWAISWPPIFATGLVLLLPFIPGTGSKYLPNTCTLHKMFISDTAHH